MTEKKTTYRDDELEHVPAVLLGGPLDGKRYRLPKFPDGDVPFAFSSPLTQPHETSPYVEYRRAGDLRIGGYYVFFFEKIIEPETRAAAEQPEHTTKEHA